MKIKDEIKNFVIVLVATIAFISTYYIMMPVIPKHMLQLGFDNLTIGAVMGLFSISSMISRPIGGVWINTHGSKKVMLISIILFFFHSLTYKDAIHITWFGFDFVDLRVYGRGLYGGFG